MARISLKGVNMVTFVKTVYDLSLPAGMGIFHYRAGPLTDAEAQEIVSRWPTGKIDMDYVLGRCCKMFTYPADDGSQEIEDRWYDHDMYTLRVLLERVGASVPAGIMEATS